jgi:hypothetical protein
MESTPSSFGLKGGKYLYDNTGIYDGASVAGKYDVQTNYRYGMSKQEEVYLLRLIEELFGKKYDQKRLIWLLRWIGLECPISNTSQCQKRFNTILNIKNEDSIAFHNLFHTSEDVLPAIQASSVFGDDQMVILSRRTPGVLNVVTRIPSKTGRKKDDTISIKEISVDDV